MDIIRGALPRTRRNDHEQDHPHPKAQRAAFYAMALVFVVLCAVLPVYKLWALLVALGGAAVAFGVAQKACPPRVVEREVPFHTGVEDVDQMLTDIQQKLDTLHALNEALPDPQLSAAMTRMERQAAPSWRRWRQTPPRQSRCAGLPTTTCRMP